MLSQIKKGSARIIFMLFSKTSISLLIGVKIEAFFASAVKFLKEKSEKLHSIFVN